MRSRLLPVSLSVLAILLGCCGCASVPRTHYYLLEWPAGAGTVASFDEPTRIGVRPFAVDPPYDQDRIVYRVGAGSVEIGFYAYHRWAVPLAEMLPTLLADALQGAPGVLSVEPYRRGAGYDLVVEGALATLEEIDTSSGPRVRVELSLSWYDAEGVLRGRREGAAESDADSDRVAFVVERMAGAVAEAVRDALGGFSENP